MQTECLVHAGLLEKPKEKDLFESVSRRDMQHFHAVSLEAITWLYCIIFHLILPNIPVVSLDPKVKICGAGQQSTYNEQET